MLMLIGIVGLLLGICMAAHGASSAQLVKDIAVGEGDSLPEQLIEMGGVLYFTASDGVHGRELWRSDGTEEGTCLVKDIYEGVMSAGPDMLTVADGKLFFKADDGPHGIEMWVSDGTEEGTILLKDIDEGDDDSPITALIEMGAYLYFLEASDLWKSDGTPEGTVLVYDNCSGSFCWYTDEPCLTNIGGRLFFAANTGGSSNDLWISDGTEEGTGRVHYGISLLHHRHERHRPFPRFPRPCWRPTLA